MTAEREERLRKLCEALKGLSEGQTEWIKTVIEQFQRPFRCQRFSESDIVDDRIRYPSGFWRRASDASLFLQ